MDRQTQFQDPNHLREDQYKDSSNLDARAALHRQFSTAVTRWQPWVFAHLKLYDGMDVLECGCGPGWLWRENRVDVPKDCRVTLTDLSPGMIAEARTALQELPQFAFEVTSIDALPFANDSFDVVVANHMLYHVPQINRALSEIKRVLRPNGRLLAATNGDNHMKELPEMGKMLLASHADLQDTYLNSPPDRLSFRLENGGELLMPYFSQVDLELYPDSLRVTEVPPLVAYVISTVGRENMSETAVAALRQHLQERLDRDGAILISKDSGLFIARP